MPGVRTSPLGTPRRHSQMVTQQQGETDRGCILSPRLGEDTFLLLRHEVSGLLRRQPWKKEVTVELGTLGPNNVLC